MFSKEEQDFIKYWEENRNKQKRFFKQIAIGLAIWGFICRSHVYKLCFWLGQKGDIDHENLSIVQITDLSFNNSRIGHCGLYFGIFSKSEMGKT
jgi:hypothetical protein